MKLAQILLFALCSSLAGMSQTAKASDDPLIFRIVPQDSTIANGSKFMILNVELLNTTQHVVRLSPAGIGAQVGFANNACSLTDGFRSQNTVVDPWPTFQGKIISIAPGTTYRQTMKLNLDPEFFAPGMYSVGIVFSGTYGGRNKKGVFTGNLTSNRVFFEVAEPDDHSAAAAPPTARQSH
jgi:hypothetical protein